MFSIVASTLRGAISRFLNYAMGKGDKKELSNTFALSLNIMLILSIIVILLTESFGLWFFYNRMSIPSDRVSAAFWCFQFSVITSVSSFLVVSFTSSIIAHEKMGVFAYIDVGEIILKFIVALLITFSLGDTDKLVLYAALIMCITLVKQMISRVYAMRHFEECRIRWYWEKKKFLEMFTYAGWSYLGKTSETFAGQGVNMVINVVFGPAVNAARTLSGTVNNAVQLFVNNFTMAIWPQVAQSYASGEDKYFKSLLFRSTKFTFFIMWMMVLPLVLETTFVVGIWLGTYPEYTISFIRIALLANTINLLQVTLGMGIKASGRIKWYQLIFSALEFLHFILAFVLLHNGFSPLWSYYCGVIVAICKVLSIWTISKQQLRISIKEFIDSVVFRLFLVVVTSSVLPLIIHTLLPIGWPRLISVVAISLITSSICILYIGCNASEREALLSMVFSKILKH